MTEREELQMLRELVKKQEEQLKAKDELIKKQNIQIENMTQALLHARKKFFGASSERSVIKKCWKVFPKKLKNIS